MANTSTRRQIIRTAAQLGTGLALSPLLPHLAHRAHAEIQPDAWVAGRRFALKALANQHFVCADNSGNDPLIANRPGVGPWETFSLTPLGGSQFAFRAEANGMYVCADAAGNSPLIANRSTIGPWETFRRQDMNIDWMGIQATNNQWVSAELAGANPLIANRPSVGTWEQFAFYDLNRMINFGQLLRAFPLQHPGMVKLVTAENMSNPRPAPGFFPHGWFERIDVQVDGSPSDDVAVVTTYGANPSAYIVDHYHIDANWTGIHCTSPVNDPNASRSTWDPYIAMAPTAFSMSNWSTLMTSPYYWCETAPGGGPWVSSSNQVAHRTILDFGVRDFLGNVGIRWYVRIGDPNLSEWWVYDLGPRVNVFEPSYGSLSYGQQDAQGRWIEWLFGNVVPDPYNIPAGTLVTVGTGPQHRNTHTVRL